MGGDGPEFLGETFVSWCKAHGIFIDYIEPGKPNQNAYIKRFNRSYRNEVLDTWLFRTLEEVRELTWAWMLEYNEDLTRPIFWKMCRMAAKCGLGGRDSAADWDANSTATDPGVVPLPVGAQSLSVSRLTDKLHRAGALLWLSLLSPQNTEPQLLICT